MEVEAGEFSGATRGFCFCGGEERRNCENSENALGCIDRMRVVVMFCYSNDHYQFVGTTKYCIIQGVFFFNSVGKTFDVEKSEIIRKTIE